MPEHEIYRRLRERALALLKELDLADTPVTVKTRALLPEEAIGRPDRDDFPLFKGKERLVQADFLGVPGQAYTDMPGPFTGSVRRALELPLDNNYRRAVFVAVLNAVARYAGLVENTVHCRDTGPAECSRQLPEFIRSGYGRPKVLFVGLQPALVQASAAHFETRVLDLDPDNIGQVKAGVLVEHPDEALPGALDWCDLALVTGTTLVNNTIGPWLQAPKPVVFYGTTIAGAAAILGLKRFCRCST